MPRLTGAWPSWLGVTLPVIVALFAGIAAYRAPQHDAAVSPVCALWDSEASGGVALLVPDSSSAIEALLDDALYQLRRARKNCRDGNVALAREDYVALASAFPLLHAPHETHQAAAPAASVP